MSHCLINGVATDFLSVDDRAFQYGDGLFETILCDGQSLLYWKMHYARLQNSCSRLDLRCPDEKTLLEDIRRLIVSDPSITGSAVIKVIVTRGLSGRGYAYDKDGQPNRIVSLSTLPKNYSSIVMEQLLSGSLYLCRNQASTNTSLAGMKHLNRLENVLARNEWAGEETIYIDGLMLDSNDYVISATTGNIFGIKDNNLYTPDLSACGVEGVMRDETLKLAAQHELNLNIQPITLDNLQGMQEIFITNSLIGIKSVSHFQDTDYETSTSTTLLFDAMMKTLSDKKHALY